MDGNKLYLYCIISHLLFLSYIMVDNSSHTSFNLIETLNSAFIDTDNPDDCYDFLGTSPYMDDESFVNCLHHKNNFTILSMNVQSLRAKYYELVLLLEL